MGVACHHACPAEVLELPSLQKLSTLPDSWATAVKLAVILMTCLSYQHDKIRLDGTR